MKRYICSLHLLLFILFGQINAACSNEQNTDRVKAQININKDKGHALIEGCSGFNVRIADKVWSYSHPDFREAVHGLKPGWLRYFSGTMGDAFNCATGLYDKDYISMFDHRKGFNKGYIFTDVKGPHRIIDLYELLGEVGGKLVVTINGFSETPEITAELARFCKNNNIVVEVWQFCNEPYFYVPHRERFWWNDGYDYAAKMKPHADEILKVFPDAKLALNCTWDGIWGFMKEIHKYQQENGHYWNLFSKHSYAPHIGGRESFEAAYRRGNTKIIEATSPAAMKQIEGYTWEGAPMLITEFGVWNTPLNGIYSAIYNAEYTLRQLEHTNAFLIGSHEISNKYQPLKNLNHVITDAYEKGFEIDTDTLRTGIRKDDEGKAMEIVHIATNNSNYTWDAKVIGGAKVPGLKDQLENGVYARAFRGTNGFDYLIVTNRSGKYHDFSVNFGGKKLNKKAYRKYMFSSVAQNKDIDVHEDVVTTKPLEVPPYSVVLVKWEAGEPLPPSPSRIYKSKVAADGIALTWWKREIADSYTIHYGKSENDLSQLITVKGADNNSYLVNGLEKGKNYYFAVSSQSKYGKSDISPVVKIKYQKTVAPQIFRVGRRDTTVTVFWQSVADATGYRVNIASADGSYRKQYDAHNVFGYRIDGLKYDVPYHVTVSAYNGLGESVLSQEEVVTCKRNLPVPPRNISATETSDGQVYLEWENQDTLHKDIQFRLYRGKKMHQFELFADGISENHFVDITAAADENYFYTVKAYTADGENDYYPNIATIVHNDGKVKIEIVNIKPDGDDYLVSVKYKNISQGGDIWYGVSVSDVSYLTVEEDVYRVDKADNGKFIVKIPSEKLRKGHRYSFKGVVNTNGKSIYSLPPHKKMKVK